MTSSLTGNTVNFIRTHAFASLSGWMTLIVVVLGIVLLVEREVVRAVIRSLPASTRRVFDVAAVPVVLTFAIIVIERFKVIGKTF
ncbi:MAG TPA: hypothetical protein VHA57_09270 [Actinomycetota bacterium]|nr:hypothetical protein [Actinomycetota bacterium]